MYDGTRKRAVWGQAQGSAQYSCSLFCNQVSAVPTKTFAEFSYRSFCINCAMHIPSIVICDC